MLMQLLAKKQKKQQNKVVQYTLLTDIDVVIAIVALENSKQTSVFLNEVTIIHILLKDIDVVIDFGFVSLRYAFGDPDDVSTLLLLQFDVRVKHTKVELLHEGIHVELYLRRKTNIYTFKSINFREGKKPAK